MFCLFLIVKKCGPVCEIRISLWQLRVGHGFSFTLFWLRLLYRLCRFSLQHNILIQLELQLEYVWVWSSSSEPVGEATWAHAALRLTTEGTRETLHHNESWHNTLTKDNGHCGVTCCTAFSPPIFSFNLRTNLWAVPLTLTPFWLLTHTFKWFSWSVDRGYWRWHT